MSTDVPAVPPLFSRLIDDAAIFPPGNAPLDAALDAHAGHRAAPYSSVLGSFVVSDVRLPDLAPLVAADSRLALSLVVTGGVGAIQPALTWASRTEGITLAGLEFALRDEDDLAHNARRLLAMLDQVEADGALAEGTPVYVELPHAVHTGSWLAAADVLADRELRLKFRTGGLEAHLFPAPHALASWIDAALDREMSFKCTAGLHQAVAHTDSETGFEHHGFLNVLNATKVAFDGAGVAAVAEVLSERDPGRVAAATGEVPDRVRRWFTGFGSCSVLEPLHDLVALGRVDGRLLDKGAPE